MSDNPKLGSSDINIGEYVQSLVLIILCLIGSFAITNAVVPTREYLSMTFSFAETRAGGWWLIQTVLAEATFLVLFLIAIATVTAIRNGGLLWCCTLTTALPQGMAVALFGLDSSLLEMVEPSVPVGVVTGIVGWTLGAGITVVTNRSSDDLRMVVSGQWTDQRRIGALLGSFVVLLFTGYVVVTGAELMTVYLERTVGRPRSGIVFFLELYLVRAPLVVVFLLGIGAGNAVRGGDVVTSSALPTAILLGMAFATFGFPPLLLNVFYQGVPAGILLGALGWSVGIGAVKLYHTRRSAAA
ncbi:hypothetical protein [Halorussus litoreus]|uniref:hypothetical protein n=1 Tax=Halorussus litoreus TaxID=1710536 RepID=UPI001300A6D8|nr:hypothetical protein [Halorussus litoreus]